jgi:hypothetical protein
MARDKLTAYQTSYAEAMKGYGLVRGREGSEARHITTGQYYRELVDKNENLKENIQGLEHEKVEVYEKVRDLYDRKDEARNKFLSMDEHVRQKDKELSVIETKLQKARQEYEPYKAQEELNLIHELFPMMKEQLRIADFCRKIGLAVESIKALFEGKSLTAKSFSFFSPEHNQKFMAEDVKLKIEKEPDNPTKLRLNINGMDILEWFRQRFEALQKAMKNRNKQTNSNIKQIKL